MPEINLTSRKKSLPDKFLGTFVREQDKNNNTIYKARYSEDYREAGHDFNRSFRVLRGAYWFKYGLLDQDDIATYETLQFLCQAEIPFTLEELAKRCGIGKSTLRQRLDNLENAELLEIIKTDSQGSQNYYILRTPFFERAEFKENVQARVLREYGEIPTSFLEDNLSRLQRNIRKNRVRKERSFQRNAEAAARFKDLAKRLKTETQQRLLIWHRILKKFKKGAAEQFDHIVWTLCHDTELLQLYGAEFLAVFKRKLKFEFQRLKLQWDEFYFDLANDLRAFYDPRIDAKRPDKKSARKSPADPPANSGDASDVSIATEQEKANVRAGFRQVLNEQREKRILTATGESLRRTFASWNFKNAISFNEFIEIAQDFFSKDDWQKLTVELRQ